MKFKAAILAVGLVAMTACGASANSGTFCIGPTAGASLPMGTYGDAAKTGWHAGATCDYNMNNGWGFGMTGAYHSWGVSDQLNPSGSGVSANWSAIQVTPQATYHFRTSGSVKPFCQAGLGLYDVKLSASSGGVSASQSKSEFGYNIGGGMDFASHGSTTWGIDTAYHIVPTTNDFGTLPNGKDLSSANTVTLGLHMQFGMSH
jgi:opacity protein-like surface antigen